jgi:hypothetical protein
MDRNAGVQTHASATLKNSLPESNNGDAPAAGSGWSGHWGLTVGVCKRTPGRCAGFVDSGIRDIFCKDDNGSPRSLFHEKGEQKCRKTEQTRISEDKK